MLLHFNSLDKQYINIYRPPFDWVSHINISEKNGALQLFSWRKLELSILPALGVMMCNLSLSTPSTSSARGTSMENGQDPGAKLLVCGINQLLSSIGRGNVLISVEELPRVCCINIGNFEGIELFPSMRRIRRAGPLRSWHRLFSGLSQ
jgi:hypothetical protein